MVKRGNRHRAIVDDAFGVMPNEPDIISMPLIPQDSTVFSQTLTQPLHFKISTELDLGLNIPEFTAIDISLSIDDLLSLVSARARLLKSLTTMHNIETPAYQILTTYSNIMQNEFREYGIKLVSSFRKPLNPNDIDDENFNQSLKTNQNDISSQNDKQSQNLEAGIEIISSNQNTHFRTREAIMLGYVCGSTYGNEISFLLTAMALWSGDTYKNWIASETLLFKARLVQTLEMCMGHERKDLLIQQPLTTEPGFPLYMFILSHILNSLNIPHRQIQRTPDLDKFYSRFSSVKDDAIFSVPFQYLPPHLLIPGNIKLTEGYAIIRVSSLIEVAATQWKHLLETTIRQAKVKYDTSLLDHRWRIVFENIISVFVGKEQVSKQDIINKTIDLKSLDEAARKQFPPCMRLLLEQLEGKAYPIHSEKSTYRVAKHHLKYDARSQLIPFLAALNMPYLDMKELWARHISAGDKRYKEILAYIEWAYGKTGRQKTVSAMNCNQCRKLQPAEKPNFHGCFFSQPSNNIRVKLNQWGVGGTSIDEIIRHSESENQQLACIRFFSGLTGKLPPDNFAHPVSFFAASETQS